ncbi:MAG TPA: archaeosine synthase subunit alpha [Thermoplasmata archaeon]|nr:archaeosine synthase subunit alpha [Thermoplasmata archaeon]
MLEIEARGGLGRKGIWTRDDRTLTTPLVLFVHQGSRAAPSYAEALLVAERTEDSRFQIRIGGSFFAPRPADNPDDLPPGKGTPRSLADLEIPHETVAGEWAVVAGDSDLVAAKSAGGMFLANGPEFERSPREFVAAVRGVRETLGPSKVVAVTGLATPSNLAVLVYSGIDVVDSSRMLLDSARGLFHTADGTVPVAEADRDACGCPACAAGEALAAHNDRALYREMLLVRNHLVHGRLRELVERRLANAPWNTAIVRHLDLREYGLVEAYTPVAGREMRAYASESLTRPEIVRFRRRIRERYGKPPSSRVLVLLPCSARKPYSTSRSHRRFRDAILASKDPSVVHEVIVTSPLGLIPRELERFYPAGAYDIPVTGDWSRDEAAMVTDDLQAFLTANRYDTVVAHLGAEAPIVRAAVPNVTPTSKERPTSDESLASLTAMLNQVTASAPRVPKGLRFSEEMSNVARFQFGEAGLGLVRGASFRGRVPDVRVIREGTQVAMYTGRGMLSLTLAGGGILSDADAYWVEIENFLPKGNIFAVGVVDAAAEIRPGDEVVVRRGNEVRAVGTARLSGREMVDFRRGEAVHVRHVLEVPP